MAKFDDLEKAKQKIEDLLKLGEEIQKATPYLNDINSNLSWYEKVCNFIPEKQDDILDNIEEALGNISSWDNSTFNMYDASGATGSFYSASADTKTIIQSKPEHYYLISEYNEINNTENLLSKTLTLLQSIDSVLSNQFNDAIATYSEWKANFKTNSDLSKDIRTFQDTFKGYLHKLRLSTLPKNQSPDFSWPKMAIAIVKSGSGCLKSLKSQGNIHDETHHEFTIIMKKTKEVTNAEMEIIFKKYIEHVFIVINLIEKSLL